MRVAGDGEGTAVEVYRALVRSHERHDYEAVQQAVDSGSADERLMLLKEVGERRIAFERRRGGASLPMPEQEVAEDEQGHFRLYFRPPLEAEDWNAQISLMTGMAAAEMMVKGGVGILRTMPEADQNAVARFRRAARALGVEWAAGQAYGEFLRGLDRADPGHLAPHPRGDLAVPWRGLHALRGRRAGAVGACRGGLRLRPRDGAPAPARRPLRARGVRSALARGRGAGVGAGGAAHPAGDHGGLGPEGGGGGAGAAPTPWRRRCSGTVSGTFPASVVDLDGTGERRQAVVQVQEPAVLARADGQAELGAAVTVRLVEAEIASGTVRFEIVS